MKKLFTAMAVTMFLAACGSSSSEKTVVEPTATPIEYGNEITLLQPAKTGGLTIDEVLWLRASSREFSNVPLSLEELSGVIWAAAGINRPESGRQTAPSALALYPIKTYVFLAGGVYLYDAAAHKLIRVVEGDHRVLAGAQPFVAQAALNLVYIADLSVYTDKPIPAEHVRFLCGQDAAGYAENANLYAAGHGLKAITRGSAPTAELLALLGLDTDRYFFALAQSIGR